MAISESKKKIVIENYFKRECDVNTSIKEAFTKGFELGLEKAPIPQPKTGRWIMRHRKVNTINYCTGEDVLTGKIHTVKELIRYETDEPYCAGCGKRAEDISQGYCGYCGAKMVKPQESEEANG